MSDNTPYTHIFVAYASEDQTAADTFLSVVKSLKKRYHITISKNQKLQKADTALLLISVDFMISDEYEKIKQQLQNQPATEIIPVLIRPCSWEEDSLLNGLETLPANGDYVKDSKTVNERNAYKKIGDELREIIAKREKDFTPVHSNTNKKPWSFQTILSVIIGLGLLCYAIAQGLALIAGLNADVPPLVDEVTESKPPQSTNSNIKPYDTLIPKFGKPIFTKEDPVFKFLIIRFEDTRNKEDDTYCIGRSVEESLLELKEKGFPIKTAYADSIPSPKYSGDAKALQKYHNADVLMYGRAEEIQENCTAANVCFRRVISDTIMANVIVPDSINKINHDFNKSTRFTIKDIEQGNYYMDEQSVENWVRGLIALKKKDTKTYFASIEDMTKDIEGLEDWEKFARFYAQGSIYLHSKQYEKSILSFDNAFKLKQDYAELYFNRGLAYGNLGDSDKAILDYGKAIKLNPNLAEAYNNRARIYGDRGDSIKAILDYNKAIKLNPKFHIFYNNRAVFYEEFGDFDKAILDYNEVIKLKPDFAEAYNGKGTIYRKQGDTAKTILNYDKAIELKPDFYIALNNRAVIYSELKKFDKAVLDYDEATKIEPKYIQGYDNKSIMYFELYDYEKVVLNCTKVIQLNPNYSGDIYTRRAEAYHALKEYDSAILDYDAATRLIPNYGDIYIAKGRTYQAMKKYDEAILDYGEALRLIPNDSEIYIYRGNSYFSLKKYDEAIADYDEALRLNPDYKYQNVYINRGMSYYKLKNYDKAIVDIDTVIASNPSYSFGYYCRGGAFYKLKEYEKAVEDYSEALRLNPSAYSYNARGFAYCQLKKYKNAISDSIKAIKLKPFFPRAYLNLLVSFVRGNFFVIILLLTLWELWKRWRKKKTTH